jgi:methionyl-tRNA formyltransferase
MIIGYFADGPWSHGVLDKLLLKTYLKIGFICVRYDHQDSILKEKAKKNKIPILTSANINNDKFINDIRKYNCDLFVSMSFNQIFKKKIIETPPLGIINCHAGKLPFYRGRNILNWALINDESEFGITVHYIDEGIDTGDIILQKCYAINDNDNYNTLLQKAYSGCEELLNQSIDNIYKGIAERVLQSSIDPLGFYCSKRKIGDEKLNWYQSSRQIFNFVRAICPPGPCARCYVGNKEILVKKVDYFPNAFNYMGKPGTILAKNSKGLLVKTLDSFVQLVDWTSDIKLKVGDHLK